jgi:hypothetical protein
MLHRLIQKFGIEADFIDTGVYHTTPYPDDPQAIAAEWQALPARGKVIASNLYDLQFKQWFDDDKARIVERPKIFSHIHESLSSESRNKVESAKDWAAIYKLKDPLQLWQIIVKTHEGGGESLIIPFSQRKITKEYTTFSQAETESTGDCKCRFDEIIRSFTSICGVAPTNQAATFSGGLDPKRYSAFEMELSNQVIGKFRTFPINLQDMYELITSWVNINNLNTTNNTNKVIEAGVFAIKSSESNHEISNNSSINTVVNTNGGTFNSKRPHLPKYKRRFCSKMHWDNECPSKPDDNINKNLELKASQPIKKDGTAYYTGVVLITRSEINDEEQNFIRLDNQASVSIFNDTKFLKNIKQISEPIHITGIVNGPPLVVTHMGDFRDICKVYYHPDAAANIISFSDALKNKCDITYNQYEGAFKLVSPRGDKYLFCQTETHNSHICILPEEEWKVDSSLSLSPLLGGLNAYSYLTLCSSTQDNMVKSRGEDNQSTSPNQNSNINYTYQEYLDNTSDDIMIINPYKYDENVTFGCY